MTVDGVHQGMDGRIELFPVNAPWTPEAGFVVEQPPAQLDDALARAVAKTRPPEAEGRVGVS